MADNQATAMLMEQWVRDNVKEIKQRNEAEADGNKHMPMCLPCDATAMDNALYDLSRFMKKFNRLGSLLERNEKMPAFRMKISNDDDVDSI